MSSPDQLKPTYKNFGRKSRLYILLWWYIDGIRLRHDRRDIYEESLEQTKPPFPSLNTQTTGCSLNDVIYTMSLGR